MKVAMLNDVGLPPDRHGGIEHYTKCLGELLHENSHQVTIIAPLRKEIPAGVPIIGVKPAGDLWKGWGDFAICYTVQLYRLLSAANKLARDVDVIHAHNPFVAGLVGRILSQKHNTCSVLTYHYWGIYERHYRGKRVTPRERVANLASTKYDIVVVNSRSMKDALVSRAGVSDARIEIIPPCVDLEAFNPQVDGRGIRGQHNLPEDSIVILYVGRLSVGKGVKDLIAAFSKVKAPGAHLLIVGDGEERTRLVSLSNESSMRDRILFAGAVPDELLPSYYAASDFFVLPTYGESFGMVLLEAWASGKPVITSDYPLLKNDVVSEGKNGLIHEMGNPESLAAAIRQMIDNRGLRLELGRNGRSLVEKENSKAVFLERYLRVYRRAKCMRADTVEKNN